MLEELTTSEFAKVIGHLAQKPIVEILKELSNSMANNDGWWEAEFRGFLVKLKVAERRGMPVLKRLQQEIEEWAEILDDDTKTRLYIMGNDTVPQLFERISNNKEQKFLSIIHNLQDNLEEIEDSDEESLIFVNEINNLFDNFQDPIFFENIESRVPPDILVLMQKESDISIDEILKIIIAINQFSPQFIKLMKKISREIILSHSQMEYYQRIID